VNHKSFVVGVTGGSGSGKTRFLDELLSRFDESQITLISQDHYYKPIDDQPKDARGIENFDTIRLLKIVKGKKIFKFDSETMAWYASSRAFVRS